ncbi:hypothetical protein CHS0354_041115 [Potamilus streckersoni]|uniref:Hydroxylysine kinase n=1 Tax=Potamilus streckersoni TaxID=2493646 RepID=A0AAE0VUV9_9BIVA|nr:hypothetical protein CHS0354_041115 [Potamilus streckersoni]
MKRAKLSELEAAALVEKRFGLQVCCSRGLTSYDDLNIHVTVGDKWNNANIKFLSENGYVLKVLNSLDSKKTNFVHAMHATIRHVSDQGVQTPTPVLTVEGDEFCMEELPVDTENTSDDPETAEFLVRLFHYIPGEILLGKPYTKKLCYEVGQLGGRLDICLQGFFHSGYENHRRHWSLLEVSNLMTKSEALRSQEDKDLIRDVVASFKQNVVTKYPNLKRGIIHADLNEGNIIVKPRDEITHPSLNHHNTRGYAIYAVVDFGDSVHEYHVFELAIAMCYIMLESTILDPMEAGRYVFAGYMKENPLPELDINVLKECVCGRLAQSVVYGAHVHMHDPSNTHCLHTTRRGGWQLLRRLWHMDKITFLNLLRQTF